jgi:hypothetical protein
VQGVCLTLVGAIRLHGIDIVELATKSLVEVRIWGEQTQGLGVDKAMAEGTQQGLLLLGALVWGQDFAEDALAVAEGRRGAAADAGAVFSIAGIVRGEVQRKIPRLGRGGRRRVVVSLAGNGLGGGEGDVRGRLGDELGARRSCR